MLLRLPFDQYGRYRLAAQVLDAARPAIGERLRVLDVGGYHRTGRQEELLPARMFLPDDDVTVVDQFASDLPGYVRGDGRGLDFADRAFDFVISCDTLEHVPPADRPGFWSELLRVTRYGVVLAAPFASPEVVAAEDLLFGYIRVELGVEQLQLKEHRDYGLPNLDTTGALLDALGLRYQVYPSGYVHAWLAMMIAKHYLLGRTNDFDLHERVDEYYTRFFSADERREPAYRHVFVVEGDGRGDWWEAARAVVAPTIGAGAGPEAPGWRELASWLLQLAQLRIGSNALAQMLAPQHQHTQYLEQALNQRDAQIADLERRARWLEQQSWEARRALAAVENGRVMRLLRWMSRR
jgi:hypothetical protein